MTGIIGIDTAAAGSPYDNVLIMADLMMLRTVGWLSCCLSGRFFDRGREGQCADSLSLSSVWKKEDTRVKNALVGGMKRRTEETGWTNPAMAREEIRRQTPC